MAPFLLEDQSYEVAFRTSSGFDSVIASFGPPFRKSRMEGGPLQCAYLQLNRYVGSLSLTVVNGAHDVIG